MVLNIKQSDSPTGLVMLADRLVTTPDSQQEKECFEMIKLRLTNTDAQVVREYVGRSKHECLADLLDDLLNTPFKRTLENVFELLRENVSPMVSDEDVAEMVFEAVTNAFGYPCEWKGEEE